MKVVINDKELVVTGETTHEGLEYIKEQILQLYMVVDEGIRFVIKTFVRNKLYELEKKRGTTGIINYDGIPIPFRPEKGTDPVLHLLNVLLPVTENMLHDIVITINTTKQDNGETAITAIGVSASDTDKSW